MDRYAPYPMPTNASAAGLHATHAHVAPTASPAQTTNVQQPHPASLTAAGQATGVSGPITTPYHQAYGLPNVDMASFQNVDWSSMYGMGMYV